MFDFSRLAQILLQDGLQRRSPDLMSGLPQVNAKVGKGIGCFEISLPFFWMNAL
ncbi:hypothetical protein [Crateriforma conspicua]|uniref:hypothetical protein n=1 Tax=Crateriforma TaxID=2714592 RepID=UPI0018CDC573|nr:hypothetical protein [Crateriforma conspicua]